MWVNAVVVEYSVGQQSGGTVPFLVPLTVTFVERQAGEAQFEPVGWRPGRQDALENVRKASIVFLCILPLLLVLTGIVLCKPPRRWNCRTAVLAAWLLGGVIMLLLTFTVLLDGMLETAAWALLSSLAVIVFHILWFVASEAILAWKWVLHVLRNQICVIIEHPRVRNNVIHDGSYGVAVGLGILLALCEEDRAASTNSPFWNQFFSCAQQRLPEWSFTGNVKGLGRVTRVEDLLFKIYESLNSDMNHIVTPLQHEVFLHHAIRDGGGRIVLKRCCHLGFTVLALGGFWKAWRGIVAALALLFLVSAGAARSDIYSILAPQQVELEHRQKHGDDLLLLVLRTSQPDRCWVRFSSDFWKNQSVDLFSSTRVPELANVLIPLELRSEPKGFPMGTAEVNLRRKFIGRPLPDKVVLATSAR